jgi:hypothetical protein
VNDNAITMIHERACRATARSNTGVNASSVVWSAASRFATHVGAITLHGCFSRCIASGVAKTLLRNSDSAAKNRTLAIRNSGTGPRYGFRRPSTYATVNAPGLATSARTLRISLLSTLVSDWKTCSARPRSVNAWKSSWRSPQSGQNALETALWHVGHNQDSGALIGRACG